MTLLRTLLRQLVALQAELILRWSEGVLESPEKSYKEGQEDQGEAGGKATRSSGGSPRLCSGHLGTPSDQLQKEF